MEHLERFNGTSEDSAAGIAAFVLRRWKTPERRSWFAGCMFAVAEMLDDDVETPVPMLQFPSTTVSNLKEARANG